MSMTKARPISGKTFQSSTWEFWDRGQADLTKKKRIWKVQKIDQILSDEPDRFLENLSRSLTKYGRVFQESALLMTGKIENSNKLDEFSNIADIVSVLVTTW